MPSFIQYWDFEDGLQGWTGNIAYDSGRIHVHYPQTAYSPLVSIPNIPNILPVVVATATRKWYNNCIYLRVYDDQNNKIAETRPCNNNRSGFYVSLNFPPKPRVKVTYQEIDYNNDSYLAFVGILDWNSPQDALVEQVIFSFTDKVRSYDAPVPSLLTGFTKHVLHVVVTNKQMQTLSQSIVKPDGSELGWGFVGYTTRLTVQNASPTAWRIKTQSNSALQQVTQLDGKLFVFDSGLNVKYIANMKTYILSNPFSPGNYSTSLVSPNADNSVDFDKTIVLDFLAKTINIFNLKLIPEVSTTLNTSDFTQLEVQVTVKDKNGNELGTSTIDLLNSSSTTGSPITIPKDLDGQHLEVDIRLIAKGTITQEGNVAVSFTVASELPQ